MILMAYKSLVETKDVAAKAAGMQDPEVYCFGEGFEPLGRGVR